MEWIHVNRKLPDSPAPVLIATRQYIALASWNAEERRFEMESREDAAMISSRDITHWMPMPELPKERHNDRERELLLCDGVSVESRIPGTPVEYTGKAFDKEYYFRSRGKRWSMAVAESVDQAVEAGGAGEEPVVIEEKHSRCGGDGAAHENRIVRPKIGKRRFRQGWGGRQRSIHNDIAQPLRPRKFVQAALNFIIRPIVETESGILPYGLLGVIEVFEDRREPFSIRESPICSEDAGKEIAQDVSRVRWKDSDLSGSSGRLNFHPGPGGAEEHVGAARPELTRLARVADLVNAWRLKPVLQMKRQPSGMFHRMSGDADVAATEPPDHSTRMAQRDARQEFVVPAHFELVTTQVVGFDADVVLNPLPQLLWQLDMHPDGTADADGFFEGKRGHFLPTRMSGAG